MSQTHGDPGARRDIVSDLASGTICLALAAALALVHFTQGGRLHADYGAEPGPALLPELLLACLALTGAGLALRGLVGLRRHRWRGPAFPTSDAALTWVVPAALALLASFLPLREAVGAVFAFIALGAALGALAGRTEGRAPLRAALEGMLVAAVLYALFRFGLSVPLR